MISLRRHIAGAARRHLIGAFLPILIARPAGALPPSIVSPPTSATVTAGESATFSVAASASPAPHYQWLKNGVPIVAATNSSFTIAAVGTRDAGSYSIVVSNSDGAITSPAADLIVPAGFMFTTFAGSASRGLADGTGSAARFNYPIGLALDPAGDLYIADYNNHAIRKLTPSGVVTTIAGKPGTPGAVDGAGAQARFNHPRGVALDRAGNLYVADQDNHAIRKISGTGEVSTFAGRLGVSGRADGATTDSRFFSPGDVTVDVSGTLFVTDSNNHTVRKISISGVVTTIAGSPGASGMADGAGAAARFNFPLGLTTDSAGNLYVADMLNRAVRKITPDLQVTTLPGPRDGTPNGGPGSFEAPADVAVDAAGNVFLVDVNLFTVRKVTPEGAVTTIAGANLTNGHTDAPARFENPSGLAIDAEGTLFIADSFNNTIRRMSPAGVVTTLAGRPPTVINADGFGPNVVFNTPTGVAVDRAGNVYVSEVNGSTIRKITPAGNVSTLAGRWVSIGTTDGPGANARFFGPLFLAVGPSGNLYTTDSRNSTVRKITPDGTVSTLAGRGGSQGFVDDKGAAARFMGPTGIAVDAAENVYVADYHAIRKIAPDGAVTTFAGEPGERGAADGALRDARFYGANGLVFDAAGDLYIADTANCTVRKITREGVVSTIAGAPGQSGQRDGIGSVARFGSPNGITIDRAGNLYLTDTTFNTIRMIAPDGRVTTIGGLPGTFVSITGIGSTDGIGTASRFYFPVGIAVDDAGELYIADTQNYTVRKATRALVPTSIAASPRSQGALPGDAMTLSVVAAGTGPFTYQWIKNGVALAGATGSELVLATTHPDDAGRYTVVVTGESGAVTSFPANVAVSDGAGAQLVNLSARAFGADGNDALIAGFVMDGSEAKKILVRGGGPVLSSFGVAGALPLPQVALFSSGSMIASNTGWADAPQLATAFASVGATPFAAGAADAALIAEVNVGTFSVQVSGRNATSGIALAEVYDLTPRSNSTRLTNLSVRAMAGSGANTLVAGFVLSGPGTTSILFRAVGPTLTSFGVDTPLMRPELTLVDAQGRIIASNDRWTTRATDPTGNWEGVALPMPVTNALFARAGAFPLPADSADAALALSLPAGAYTIQITGVTNASGIVLAEIYELR